MGEDGLPNWLAAKMKLLRPVLETGYESVLMMRLCAEEAVAAQRSPPPPCRAHACTRIRLRPRPSPRHARVGYRATREMRGVMRGGGGGGGTWRQVERVGSRLALGKLVEVGFRLELIRHSCRLLVRV